MGPLVMTIAFVSVTQSLLCAQQVNAWIQQDPSSTYLFQYHRIHQKRHITPLPTQQSFFLKTVLGSSTCSDDSSNPLNVYSAFVEDNSSLADDAPSIAKTTSGSSNREKDPFSASTLMMTTTAIDNRSKTLPNKDVGGYDPSERLGEGVNVGDPQIKVKEKDQSVTSILRELAAIQQQGPQKYCILGTRHCSYLHQQIIELLAYALVLSGNHVYTSGAGGTHAATIRGALRAERPDLLTVVLPQSLSKQTQESQILLKKVEDVIEMPQNNDMSLDVASRICNSYLLSLTDQLISFAFHESSTVIEAVKEAKDLEMLVTVLYLD